MIAEKDIAVILDHATRDTRIGLYDACHKALRLPANQDDPRLISAIATLMRLIREVQNAS